METNKHSKTETKKPCHAHSQAGLSTSSFPSKCRDSTLQQYSKHPEDFKPGTSKPLTLDPES